MAKSIRVMIGGREYSLKGDNEKLIQLAAHEVNRHLEEFGPKYNDESAATISILTALNIAEKYYIEKRQKETDEKYVSNELNGMADFLIKSLKPD